MKNCFYALFAITFAIITTLSAHARIRENGGLRAPMAVEIEFKSLGNGIDRALKEEVGSLVEEYEATGSVSRYSENRWGFEGEITICVQLKEWSTAYELSQKIEALIGAKNLNTSFRQKMQCNNEEGRIDPRE